LELVAKIKETIQKREEGISKKEDPEVKFLDVEKLKKGSRYLVQYGDTEPVWVARSKLTKFKKYLDEFDTNLKLAEEEVESEQTQPEKEK
jgi:hypothetical protein